MWRELRVGCILGCMLAAIAILPVAAFAGRHTATVVCLTLFVVCSAGSLPARSFPCSPGGWRADAVVMSAPFITTMVDATSRVVYFGAWPGWCSACSPSRMGCIVNAAPG